MSDSVLGGAGKVAEAMAKEVQSALEKDKASGLKDQGAGQSQFDQVLTEKRQDLTQGQDPTVRPTQVSLESGNPEVPPIGQALDTNPVKNGFHRIMTDIMNGQNNMDGIVGEVLSGREFGHSELLVLQANVYRYSQELDLTSQVVKKGTQGLQQTFNTQV